MRVFPAVGRSTTPPRLIVDGHDSWRHPGLSGTPELRQRLGLQYFPKWQHNLFAPFKIIRNNLDLPELRLEGVDRSQWIWVFQLRIYSGRTHALCQSIDVADLGSVSIKKIFPACKLACERAGLLTGRTGAAIWAYLYSLHHSTPYVATTGRHRISGIWISLSCFHNGGHPGVGRVQWTKSQMDRWYVRRPEENQIASC